MSQITFNSQEEFEDAVMDVIKKRLVIWLGDSTYCEGRRITVSLADDRDSATLPCEFTHDSTFL